MAQPAKITQKDIRLAKRIQKLRKQLDMTQEELSYKIGTSVTWVGYLESALRKPNLAMLSKIASALKVKVSDLIPF